MKYNVLHICSGTSGGAGIATTRLNDALRDFGVESNVLCLHHNGHSPFIQRFNIPFVYRALSHLPFPYKQNKYRHLYDDLTSRYEAISFPEALFDISTHPLVKNADIINLHWLGGILNYRIFFRKVKKPIVWTLHDMNPFLGFAHYKGDVIKNPQDQALEEDVKKYKIESYAQHPSISIVNLCEWMYEHSSNSEAFHNREHYIIPNSVNTSIFKEFDQHEARATLGLHDNKPIIMFCCQSLLNARKGFDILLDSLKYINQECTILAVGNSTEIIGKNGRNSIISCGHINDEKRLALLYASADCFILPSREDNLPNTMLESLACGTPVISLSNGGMRDIISNYENGIIVNDQSSETLSYAINQFLINRSKFFTRDAISGSAKELFSPERQAEKYNSLYIKILNSNLT